MVEFMWPDGEYPMVPDKETDAEMAMAMVNTKMMVSANMVAAITPMFVENASPVGVMPGTENMPFEYVSWSALQSHVIGPGATFAIHKASIGANQEMMPTGDAVYITCGPFACMEGMEAPEPSIADSDVCNDWEYDIALQVGFVDNTAMNLDPSPDTPIADADEDGDGRLDDGIDVGWVYTSNTDLEVTHHFGNTLMVEAKAKKQSRTTALSVSGGGPALLHAAKENAAGTDEGGESLALLFGVSGIVGLTERWACDSTGTDGDDVPSDYNRANLSVTKPDGCFRISANGVNYLADYAIELAAVGSAVSWGSVDWEKVFEDDEEATNPFMDLSCDTVMVAAADEVDVCALFEDEVDRALEAGWGGGEVYFEDDSPAFRVDTSSATADVPGDASITFETESTSKPRQFGTIWYDVDGDGKPTDDLYRDDDDGDTEEDDDTTRTGLVIELLDDDGDPMYGDIGKLDRRRASKDGKTKNMRADAGDGVADNYSDNNAKCSDDDGGDGCDAKVVIEKDFTFVSGTAFDCEVERTVMIECTWDAQGQMNLASSAPLAEDGGNLSNFLSCKEKE